MQFIQKINELFRKNKVLIFSALGFLTILLVFSFLVFGKPKVGNAMSLNYSTDPTYRINKCSREIGYEQRLTGVFDNVTYCVDFPMFDNKKWSKFVFDEINNIIYRYKKTVLDKKLVKDKFELYGNYQTFDYVDKNDEEVASIQFQFLEKNLTKKTSHEFLKTFVFKGDELVDARKLFKKSGMKKVVDEIRKQFVQQLHKNKINCNKFDLNKIFPYNLHTIQNFVLTKKSIIFFYERGSILPAKYGIVSVELDKSKINDFVKGNVKNGSEKFQPAIALTFDDGPDVKNTNTLLDILKENGASATFFVVGKNAKQHPEILKRMVDEDHEIGNHTYNHSNLNALNERKFNEEINATEQIISEATGGYKSNLVRPPGGYCNKKVLNLLKYPSILWSIDTLDWKHRNPDKTISKVLDNAKDGDIVLMHDIHSESIEAAKVLIPKLAEKFDLVTVSELFDNKNETLEPHKSYFKAKSLNNG